jgi:thiol-disulfide isomerase/thioredoxin
MMKFIFGVLLAALVSVRMPHTSTAQSNAQSLKGLWDAYILLDGDSIHFQLSFLEPEKPILINGSDRQPLFFKSGFRDSIVLGMHIYDADIIFKAGQEKLLGYYIKHDAATKDYKLPFLAIPGAKNMECPLKWEGDITGHWQTLMVSAADGKVSTLLGVFSQEGCRISGTFLTASGDYRYLHGIMRNKTFTLSGFDGAFTIAINGKLVGNDSLIGVFRSSKGKYSTIKAQKLSANAEAPTKEVEFKKGEKVSLSLMDANGRTVSLNDPAFANKIILLQVLGSWCPNCLDEATYLNQWVKSQPDVAIIGLAFERKSDFDYAAGRIASFQKRLGLQYPILFAGKADKSHVLQQLPVLTDFGAYPTLLYLDKQQKVQFVNTGFSGPATGVFFDQWRKDLETKISMLRGNY